MQLITNSKIFDSLNHSLLIKRIVDVVLSLLALILLSPVLVIVAVLVRVLIGSPILFIQARPGLNERLFALCKFRSMRNAHSQDGVVLSDEKRLSKFGRLLRHTSLDELPELLNVILGDMSLVGPRPLLAEYLPLYNEEQARRHEVKPGITGWAQINGRNAISWDDRFRLDVWYVDNWSISLDFKILWTTVKKVLRGEGVTATGHATMPKFEGKSGNN